MRTALPISAAWRHAGAREGFESVFFASDEDGHRVDGCTTAVEDGEVWTVAYAIAVDRDWRTQVARVRGRSARGAVERRLEIDHAGRWTVDGVPRPDLDGCVDVDLEASACTNAFPVRRLRLAVGETADAPAAYVRAADLTVSRLEQRYHRIADHPRGPTFDYRSPTFDFSCQIAYDAAGLVLDYPGIAVRVG